MEILVIIDEEDKQCMRAIAKMAKQGLTAEYYDARTKFWHNMLVKYPAIKNRRIGINIDQGFIFDWNSPTELYKYSSPKL